MQRWKTALFNSCILLNSLLVFLLLLENRLVLPVWLQVTGRFHPLILHFPIVLIVLYIFSSWFIVSSRNNQAAHYTEPIDLVLLLAALSAVITALAGLFLSREEGYDTDALQWHKWSGTAVSILTLAWYYFRKIFQTNKLLKWGGSLIALCLIIFTGHQGAVVTHGQGFLFAPAIPEKKQPSVSPEDAVVFTHMIQPILESKCISCHNTKKAKGELVMETEFLLQKGGKSGVLWDSLAPDAGLLLRRIHLPLEAKKHMPPQGKPQLTEEEIEILTQWIRKGSDFKLRVADLPSDDTLRLIATRIFSASEMAEYDFEEASTAVIESLNTENRVVSREYLGSPALSVNFFNNSLFRIEQVRELSAIKKQVVSLDLSKMPVKDEDLALIVQLENLRRLNLSFTSITGNTLQELGKLKFLKSLSLSGTSVNTNQLMLLAQFPQLKTVYTWNTTANIDQLQQRISNIRFEAGFRGDTIRMKLSLPVIQNEESIISGVEPLKLKHYINGTTIRYTTDGSEPDSIHSAIFKGGETINGSVLVRAKAYKPGWISSDIMETSFYKSGYRPDTSYFLTAPDPSYQGSSKILTDLIKGKDYRDGNWLGWTKTNMNIMLSFDQPVTLESITLSTLVDIGGYIMPPVLIEVRGGDDPKKLVLLGKVTPLQPKKMVPSFQRGYECRFNPVKLKFIQITAIPVSKLPSWHPGKGDKGWIFTDEILLN